MRDWYLVANSVSMTATVMAVNRQNPDHQTARPLGNDQPAPDSTGPLVQVARFANEPGGGEQGPCVVEVVVEVGAGRERGRVHDG